MVRVEKVSKAENKQRKRVVIVEWLRMVRFSHTLFAMPFALVGFTMAWADGAVDIWRNLLLVVLCMVFARTAAMGFNRIVDRKIDALNERTSRREIPLGKITLREAWLMVVTCCVLFVVCAGLLNVLVLALTPIALLVVLCYSYLKRFTWLCHFGVGMALGLAPVGAYLAVRGVSSGYLVMLGLGVMLWVSGFDIIYAMQDMVFDRANNVHSIPARFGLTMSLRIAYVCSLLSIIPIGYSTFHYAPTPIGIGATGFFLGTILVQLLSVKLENLSNINGSFMRNNGIASLLYGVMAIVAIVGRGVAVS